MLKDLKEKFYKNYISIIFIVVIIVGIIATVCIFYFSKDSAQAGTIGDTIGGVFTALAFICAMFAIVLQSKELSLQRKELKQTRDELRGQKEQFEIQNKTLKRQQFENTFFNMLKTQENIVSNLRLSTGEVARRVIRTSSEWFVNEINDTMKENEIIEQYNNPKFKYLQEFDHYFRHMYRILKFVDKTDFSFCLDENMIDDKNIINDKIRTEKYNYVASLRAILSTEELVLLFYNALCYPKMKKLIVKYSFLQNIRFFDNTLPHFMFYKEDDFNAFGNRKEGIKQELKNKELI